jgi:hypothetical protein
MYIDQRGMKVLERSRWWFREVQMVLEDKRWILGLRHARSYFGFQKNETTVSKKGASMNTL